MALYLHVPLTVVAMTSASPPDFAPARRVLEQAVADRAFPGCAVAVGTHDRVLWIEGAGRLDYDGGPPATPDTMYDLASLTKVVGTTTVLARLAHQDGLSLKGPVAAIFPELDSPPWRHVSLAHLLTHSAGLPAWLPLYRERQGGKQVVAGALGATMEAAPGTRERYSDLGFIILGEAARRVSGKPLPVLERERVFDVLGMADTCRSPGPGLAARIAPTEVRPQRPGEAPRATRGVVHDENALAADGDAGHAGLFSTSRDLARFAQAMLRSWRGEGDFLPQPLVRELVGRAGIVAGSSRALGWDTPSGASSSGRRFGPRSFGHTGFTGTSIWIDPDRDLFLVLLSNRVHPSRDNSQIVTVRRRLADVVVACIEGRIARL